MTVRTDYADSQVLLEGLHLDTEQGGQPPNVGDLLVYEILPRFPNLGQKYDFSSFFKDPRSLDLLDQLPNWLSYYPEIAPQFIEWIFRHVPITSLAMVKLRQLNQHYTKAGEILMERETLIKQLLFSVEQSRRISEIPLLFSDQYGKEDFRIFYPFIAYLCGEPCQGIFRKLWAQQGSSDLWTARLFCHFVQLGHSPDCLLEPLRHYEGLKAALLQAAQKEKIDPALIEELDIK